MTTATESVAAGAPTVRERAVWLATVAGCAILPAVVVVTLFATAISAEGIAMDFRQFYRAAEKILAGESPYLPAGEPLLWWGGPYPYPPLPALTAIPLTLLSLEAAGLVVMAALVLVVPATLAVLGVRDWRCYGIVMLWPPVISAIQTGNVTLWFGLALAVAWRFRDRWAPSSAALGLTLAVKFFLWPVVVWLAATRRYAAAVASCVIGAALLVASWVPLGFAGFVDYPDMLRRLEDTVGDDSYTLYIVGLDAGLPSEAARAVWIAVGGGLLAASVALARRGEERASFLVAVAACLALSPIVWLHYFALLVVAVAIARPRLGVLWLAPLAFVLTPGSGAPTPFETSWTLAVAALVLGWCVRDALGSSERRAAEPVT